MCEPIIINLHIYIRIFSWACLYRTQTNIGALLNLKKKPLVGFPGGSVIKNLPDNAGDMGSNPDPGRSHMLRSNYAHAPQLLSLCSESLGTATTKAHVLECPHSATGEATAVRSPCSLQLEKVCTAV